MLEVERIEARANSKQRLMKEVKKEEILYLGFL
jgi:hypothetical protein